MFFNDVTNSGSIPLLESMLSFTQAQHRVLAENIANIDTPGYRTKQLDPAQFQRALADAVGRRSGSGDELRLEGGTQFEQGSDGRLRFVPVEEPADNVLFHDQTNARIESQMARVAENAMMHQTMTELLTGAYGSLMKSIRGRVS